jgi:hypothetical protein
MRLPPLAHVLRRPGVGRWNLAETVGETADSIDVRAAIDRTVSEHLLWRHERGGPTDRSLSARKRDIAALVTVLGGRTAEHFRTNQLDRSRTRSHAMPSTPHLAHSALTDRFDQTIAAELASAMKLGAEVIAFAMRSGGRPVTCVRCPASRGRIVSAESDR